MTNPVRCRDCTGLAIIGSAAVHGVALGALWWAATSPAPAQAPEDMRGQEVAVTLAMFGGPSLASGELTPPAAAPVVEPPQVEPEPSPTIEPEVPIPSEPSPEPEPDPEPVPEPVVQPEPPPPLLAESPPKPKVKPKPPPRPQPITKPKPKRSAPEVTQVVAPATPPPARVAPVAAASAQVAVTPAIAVPGAAAGAGGATATGDTPSAAVQEGAYLKGLTQAIARNRFYPPEAQRQDVSGVVVVAFTIRADGGLTGFHVAKGSGSDVIDQAAVETVRRLGSYKPIPAGIGRSQWPVKVPIRFDLR